MLAFAPEEADPGDRDAVVEVGRKVAVVRFGDGGVVQVVPVEGSHYRRALDSKR